MLDSSINETLFSKIAEEYIGKLYYFSLKKTGNSFEAEDLTSDIMLNIFQSIGKGNIPQNLSAYIWQIARNRYSVWADKKNKLRKNMSITPIDDYEICDEKTVLDETVKAEQVALLRRELAFITKDYREIVVAYYIENKSIGNIAEHLKLPKGTVKSKLYRARNILKEGINMAREFGLRSYNPEDIAFVASGSQPSGLPWKAVNRMIPKNILLQASNNPSTVEELAIELGVAVPYMEDEVEILVESTLLAKQGNKYVTNFFILDKETQQKSYQVLRKGSVERSELINRLADVIVPELRKLDVVRNGMSDNGIKWWLLFYIVDLLCFKTVNHPDISNPIKRANGETWGFYGFELLDLGEKIFMGLNVAKNETNRFETYKINDCNMTNRVGEMNCRQTELLADIIRNKRNLKSLTESERNIFKDIENRFVHCDNYGNVIPDILVFENDSLNITEEITTKHPLFGELKTLYKAVFDEVYEILKKNSTELLKPQLIPCVAAEIFKTRMMTFHDSVTSGNITIPADPDNSTVAMCIIVG